MVSTIAYGGAPSVADARPTGIVSSYNHHRSRDTLVGATPASTSEAVSSEEHYEAVTVPRVTHMPNRMSTRVRRGLGLARRSLRRVRFRSPTRVYEPPNWEHLAVDGTDRPRHRMIATAFVACGTAALRTEHWLAAQRFFERAVRFDPLSARAWRGLGESLLSGGYWLPSRVEGIGVLPTRIGDPASATVAFERLTVLEPGRALSWVGLGRAQLNAGDLETAAQTLRRAREMNPRCGQAWFWQARLLETRARLRGAPTREEMATLIETWQRTLDIDPGHESARFHLVRAQLSTGDFAGARANVASHPNPAARVDLTALASLAADPHARDDLFLVDHAQLLDEHRIVDAYRVKELLAHRVASRAITASSPVSALLEVARALNYCGLVDEALSLLSGRRRAWMTRNERLAMDKLAADIHLGIGDAGPLTELFGGLSGRAVNPGPERKFDELVRGRRLAVIGPADTDADAIAATVGRADTVITTKQPILGSQPVVTYMSDSSAMLLRAESASATADVSVVRPSLAPLATIAGLRGADVRFMPSEDSTTFFATRFGIQRILYDLIPYEPASIELAAVDFFLGARDYRAGYTEEMETIFDPLDLQPALSRSVHDYKADFRFTRALLDSSVISASPDVKRILQLDPEEYLRRLERAERTGR